MPTLSIISFSQAVGSQVHRLPLVPGSADICPQGPHDSVPSLRFGSIRIAKPSLEDVSGRTGANISPAALLRLDHGRRSPALPALEGAPSNCRGIELSLTS